MILAVFALGSSPRVRGTRGDEGLHELVGGIIPACAGNTGRRVPAVRGGRDHPRVCGEHFGVSGVPYCAMGSSPRVRGTLGLEVRDGPVLGIIPACAGNTRAKGRSGRSIWDHPRVCGEHRPAHPVLSSASGSSPRVRGTRLPVRSGQQDLGIIPACAGNTRGAWGSPPRCRDHPRVCGEHAMEKGQITADEGSSPRVRGTPSACCLYSGDVGITPACAGNTRFRELHPRPRRDHPRVCGEHRKWYFLLQSR